MVTIVVGAGLGDGEGCVMPGIDVWGKSVSVMAGEGNGVRVWVGKNGRGVEAGCSSWQAVMRKINIVAIMKRKGLHFIFETRGGSLPGARSMGKRM